MQSYIASSVRSTLYSSLAVSGVRRRDLQMILHTLSRLIAPMSPRASTSSMYLPMICR